MHRIIVLLALVASACTTATDMPYTPVSPPLVQARAFIGAVTTTDARDERDPTYVGAIRGGYGNPLKTIVTKRPIAEEVGTAFAAALAARHMQADGAPARLAIRVTKFSANQYFHRDAKAAFDVTLTDAAGRQIYADSVDNENSNGSVFVTGILASADDLHALMVQTMSEAIDQALDKPGLLAAAKPGS